MINDQVKNNYDSDFCGSVPLNFVNQIQPYGLLMIVEKATLNILQSSVNSAAVMGIEVEQLVNSKLSDYVQESQLDALNSKFKTDIDRIPQRLSFDINGRQYDFLAIIHSKDVFYILELELLENKALGTFIDVYQEIKYSMTSIDRSKTLKEVYDVVISELKRISGFDRVMIYQFDEDWNGIVVAEVLEPEMEPYLGLRFPASDIPKQARALYQKNPYRLIPNRDYVPEKLYPILNPLTHAFTDLSDCNMRGVAIVHLEYLKNMGVVSSMSTRIMKDNKLWGLIACHHRTEKFLGFEERSVFELLSEIISTKLSSLQNEENFNVKSHLQEIQAKLIEQIYSDNSIPEGIVNHNTNILHLLQAEGAAVIYNNTINTIGNAPDKSYIKDLALWLQSKEVNHVTTTSELSSVYENSTSYKDIASGIIVVPLNSAKGEFIIGFRPEVVKNVQWGGNPNEAINFEGDGKSYHPRNSFKLWQQTVQSTSTPWHSEEIAVAENFRNILVEYNMRKMYS